MNRIDEIVRFHKLTEADIRRIIVVQLRRLEARLNERDLNLVVTDAAAAQLSAEGYDPDCGARPLRRVLQRRIEDPLALALLEGRFPPHTTVTVDVEGDEIVLS